MITAHAIARPTSVLYNVFIIPSANGNVFISCFEQDTIGHKKLFHAPTNVKIDKAIIDDFTIGNTTLKKIRKRPQPSILAALIRSSGISRMACRIINTPNAVGNGKILENGEVRKMDVKVGDRVLFGKYAGQTVKVDGQELLVMREEDIMGVLEA